MISIDLDKAKQLAHVMRRHARTKAFAPYDNAIAKQIPGEMEGAEEARQAIREKYARMQDQIDAAQSVGDLNAALMS